MAEAYASLLNVMHIIDQLQHHPRPPISLDKQQAQSLTQNVSFLQQFLEHYTNLDGSSKEADALESRIADSAHGAEDVIESHIVDQILGHGEETTSVDFYQSLQKVVDDMELMKKEVMDVKERYQLRGNWSTCVDGSSRSASAGHNITMVGCDDALYQVLDKLTGEASSRQIISITGMGGIGKTTLARNVYQHQLIVEHFDFLAWVTISQRYTIGEILLKLLGENLSQEEENELGCMLHQKLSCRRYLIIIDDIWDIQVWEGLTLYLPDNNNGSRIITTTRLLSLARQIDESHIIEMDFLDHDNCWKLFCNHVFGEEGCPIELFGIGNEIVGRCKGLPLSISVVGGLLAKSPRTRLHWEHTAQNLTSTVNVEDDEHCLQILYLSYNSLPVHLMPCFLYMGVFREDEEIDKAFVIKCWIAEGFVKPICGKSLEEAAEEYLNELVDRNLMYCNSVDKSGEEADEEYYNAQYFMIHDLLRDLCIRESEKQKFYCVVGEGSFNNISHSIHTIRRICVAENTPEAALVHILESASVLRSFWFRTEDATSLPLVSSPLSRVVMLTDMISNLEDISHQVNLRIICIEVVDECKIPSSITRFWNLQVLLIDVDVSSDVAMAPYEIWMMPQLRCIAATGRICLPDPSTCECVVLKNLRTLAVLQNLKCSEEVVKRIPNIKYLVICYTEVEGASLADYCLTNLTHLRQLEVLKIGVEFPQSQMAANLSIAFPLSLKKLYLSGTSLSWDDVNVKIGSLPLLQKLTLECDSCKGSKWETIEGQFCSLTFLRICCDLENWVTESTHFPRLKSLMLESLHKLNEIPFCIGDIPTLELISVEVCSASASNSAERIKEEQQQLGNEDLQVRICDVIDEGGDYETETETENEC